MDWNVPAPWGKIACVSWGSPQNPTALLIHGYMDSAATFIPLVKYLSKNFHYVAVDMPGHGRSDPFPVGLVVTHAHQVEAVRRVVQHLNCNSFVYISHSVGFIIGVLYNVLYPGRIKKMVHIDPVPSLSTYCYHEYDLPLWYKFTHQEYYDNYSKWNIQRTRTFTYEEAVNLLMTKRNVNQDQAEVLLSRTLVPVGDRMYRFSWEPSMKKVSGLPITEDGLFDLIKTSPPTLNIVAQDSMTELNEKGVNLIRKFENRISNFHVVNVAGSHDVHVTNPDRFVNMVNDFLDIEYKQYKSKL